MAPPAFDWASPQGSRRHSGTQGQRGSKYCGLRESADLKSATETVPITIPSAQWVLPGFLVVGDATSAGGGEAGGDAEEVLRRHGITHIVNCAEEIECFFPRAFVYLHLLAKDEKSQNMISFWPVSNSFIDEARVAGGRVLLHSGNGRSRAGSTAVAYLMQRFDLEFADALVRAKAHGRSILPNVQFCEQLREFRHNGFQLSPNNCKFGEAGTVRRLSPGVGESTAKNRDLSAQILEANKHAEERRLLSAARCESVLKHQELNTKLEEHRHVGEHRLNRTTCESTFRHQELNTKMVEEHRHVGEHRQNWILREELSQVHQELRNLHEQSDLQRELMQARAELEQTRSELKAMQQTVKRSEENLTLGRLGFKVSLRRVATDSADALEGSFSCGTLPSGHPLRVCVKPLCSPRPTADLEDCSLGTTQPCQYSPSVVVDENSEATYPFQQSRGMLSPSGSLASINLTPAGSPSRNPVVAWHLPPGSLSSTHDGKRSAKLSYSQSSVQTISAGGSSPALLENDAGRGADIDPKSPAGMLTAQNSPGQSRRSSVCRAMADAMASVEQGL